MENYNLLYSYNREIEESSDSENSYDEELNNDRLELNKTEYQIKTYNLIINSTDRDWSGLHKNTFDFQIRFNSSETSNEQFDIFTDKNGNQDLINKFYRNVETRLYNGTKTLNIQQNLKNIDNIRVDRIILPSRNVYLGNGNFLNMLHIKTISLIIDEFNNISYGTNNSLNKSFGTFIPLTPVYTDSIASRVSSFIEFKNICKEGKTFRPSPLNSLNSLNIKLCNTQGDILNYQNNYLTIDSISIHSDNKYLKIVTKEYFYRENYLENDIIIFNNIQSSDTHLKNHLESQKHKILFNSDLIKTTHLNMPTLVKEFFIVNKGIFNNENFVVDNNLSSGTFDSVTGNILNLNLQLMIYMEVNCKQIKNIIFNPEIV